MDPDPILEQARELHKAGRLAQAELLYRQILRDNPRHAEALHLLGVIADASGQKEAGINLIRHSVQIEPNNAIAWSNLGLLLARSEHHAAALDAFHAAVRLNPKDHQSLNNIGSALSSLKRPDEALAAYRAAIAICPTFAEAHRNIGLLLDRHGKHDSAIAAFRAAVAADPNFAPAHACLASALTESAQFDEARIEFQTALRLNPDDAQTHNNFASFHAGQGEMHDALAEFQTALRLDPDLAHIHRNLAITYSKQGYMAEAIELFHTAMERAPDDPGAHSDFIYSLQFHDGHTAREIFDAHLEWNRRHAQPLADKASRVYANDPNPDRPLKIGYVSPDLRMHVVGLYMHPLLQHHDRAQFRIAVYSNVGVPDAYTRNLHALAHEWHDIARLTDEQAAHLIREHQVDVLVDLAQHTANNRLPLFARRPAPVQLTWLGYPGTTGMSVFDARLSDPYLDPLDSDLSLYTEPTLRLPHTYWCYVPPHPPRLAGPAPYPKTGHITFGCLNSLIKLSDAALDTWRKILDQVPDSRLLILCPPGPAREKMQTRFGDRIDFVSLQPMGKYLHTYDRIDIALDPFPYNGGITTCDALWMGVPVITLAGQTAVGRAGCSILSNIGHPEFIATSPDQYIRLAVELAQDHAQCESLREKIRKDMEASILCNAPEFAKDIESAYRTLWRNWCEKK